MIKHFRKLIGSVIGQGCSDNILIDIPRDNSLGDFYTNAAMVHAKTVGISARELAERIIVALENDCDNVAEASIAGHGFINFRLKDRAWHRVIDDVLSAGENYSFNNIANNENINVEFVSANPTGPLHTGHARNAVFGSVIVNLLKKIGYNTTSEFYINDQGGQIKSLAESIYLRYREHLGDSIDESDFSDDMYVGEYIIKPAVLLAKKCKGRQELSIEEVSEFAIEYMMNMIKEDLHLIGVTMDVYTSEREVCRLYNEEALKLLRAKDCIYDGVLPMPKGGPNGGEEWEERSQTLFRSTVYGDDIDRPIKKHDGSWTYFAGDIAYHLHKIKRGYKKMVGILGADHNGYVKRLKAVVSALSNGSASIDVRLYQLVNFMENGVPVRMSKRSGNFITLREVVERVGRDITRFMMISRHHDVMIDFDFAKAIECSMDNPVFYIQYAYARICSVFRNVSNVFSDFDKNELKNCDKSYITDESEKQLVRALSLWPEHVSSSAVALEPHRIPNYMHDIAHLLHSLWNKGKMNTYLRFIDVNDREATVARLALLEATRIVLEDGMKIIGITPMEEMK